VVGGLLVAVFFAWEAVEDSERLRRLNELRLRTAVATVDRIADDVALFTATGTPSASRPPELLDEYIALEVPGVDRVDELPAIDPRYQANVRELGRAEVARFLAKDQTTIGVWVFAGTPARIARALDRLRSVPDTVAERTSPNVLVVRSRGPSDARSLVAAGYEVRAAWLLGGRGDRLVRMILAVDRSALSASG